MRNNEELLASHMATMARTSRGEMNGEMEVDTDNDTNHLVSTTHTSQVNYLANFLTLTQSFIDRDTEPNFMFGLFPFISNNILACVLK